MNLCLDNKLKINNKILILLVEEFIFIQILKGVLNYN